MLQPFPQKKDVSPSPIQTPAQNTPRTNPPVQTPPVGQQPDFTNFFGKTDPKVEPKPDIKVEQPKPQPVQPTVIPQNPAVKNPPGMTKDFVNFFGTNGGQAPNPAPKVGPTTPPPTDEKKPD